MTSDSTDDDDHLGQGRSEEQLESSAKATSIIGIILTAVLALMAMAYLIYTFA
jgi:hypothetical protein